MMASAFSAFAQDCHKQNCPKQEGCKKECCKKESKFAVEVDFNPFTTNFGTFKGQEGGLTFKYFFNKKNALRFNVGLGFNNETATKTTEYNDPEKDVNNYYTTNQETIQKRGHNNFSLSVGYERYFKLNRRLDLYVGAEAGYRGDFYKASEEVTGEKYTFTASPVYHKTESTHSLTELHNYDDLGHHTSGYFVGGVFTGLDFTVYRGLYIGVELGLNAQAGKSIKNGFKTENVESSVVSTEAAENATYTKESSSETGVTVETIVAGSTTTTNKSYAGTTVNTGKTFDIRFAVKPELRIGWRF